MRGKMLFIVILLVFSATLWCEAEAEPNDTPDASGVKWCQNGQHQGWFNYPADLDYWMFYGYPGDTITVSTLGQTYLDTIIEIRDVNGVIVASNDDYEGSTQSYVSYPVPDDQNYYVRLREYSGGIGAYSFTIGGEFYSPNGLPNVPFNFSIPHGAIDVDPYVAAFTWTWGDGCLTGQYSITFGTSPEALVDLNQFPQTVVSRADSVSLPAPLIGGYTYYIRIFIILGGVQYATSYYSFTTAQLLLPVPFSEDFEGMQTMFESLNPYASWIVFPIAEESTNAAFSIRTSNLESPYIEKSSHNLSLYSDAYLSFRHLALLEPNADHGYVEYSADGGATWTIFPASAYLGTGNYDAPSANNPEGPCFDAGSYANWANYQNIGTTVGNWHTETFDLSPWASSPNFKIRFRAVYDNDEDGMGWVIDDIALQLYPPVVPTTPYPTVGSAQNNTNLRLTWVGGHAQSYELAFGSNPAALTLYNSALPYWDALNLAPYTTYYWKVRTLNTVGTSEWSALWNFTTQQYNTPWHQFAGLAITNVTFGSINNNSGWNGYTNYAALTTSAQCGVDLPISVSLTGGYGPEAVRIWVDVNRDAVFNNNPGSGEYWDLYWGNGAFVGYIHLPSGLPASPTRMRVQAIHTDGSDALAPSGVFLYGETEDYLLLTTDNPILLVTPNFAVFADTVVGVPSEPVRFTFSNLGGQSVNVTLTGITGTNSDCFTLTEGNAYPIVLTTNTASVDIRFLPTGAGAKTAFLRVQDNLSRNEVYYPLSGTGIGFRSDGALSFDGSGEYVNVAAAPPLQGLDKLTIETWFKWNGGLPIQFLTAKNFEELEIHTNGNVNGLRFIPTTGVYLDSYPNVLIPGVWQHLACVYDPSAGLGKIYLNGVDITAANNGFNPLTTPLQNSASPLRLGLRYDGYYALSGSLDEVRLWNSARSAEEIRNNLHLLQSPASPGIVANWRLDELSGNTAYDQIQALNGALVNMEAEDHSQSTVPLGNGNSATLTPAATGMVYDFAGTGVQLNFSRLDAIGPITITKLINQDAMREALTGQSWLIHTYDAATRTATMTCSVAEDLETSELPAYNFSLMGRMPELNASWTRLCRAASVDVETNSLSFPAVACSNLQTRIEWGLVIPPMAPENLAVSHNETHVLLHWDAVPGAARYKVFSAPNPEGIFTENQSGVFGDNSWTAPLSADKLFFQVISEID